MLLSPPRPSLALDRPVLLNRASLQAKGLLGWWSAPATRGAAFLRDMSSRGADGALTGTYVWTPDPVCGIGPDLDGSSAYANMGQPAHLANLGKGAFSVTAWVRRDAINAGQTIVNRWDAANQGWSFLTDPGGANHLELYVPATAGTLGSAVGTTTLSTGVYHLAGTYAGSGVPSLYVNGQPESLGSSSSGASGTEDDTTFDFVIGRISNVAAFYWSGIVFDVRIYKRVLSPAEVFQQWAPQTRWELYAPVRQRVLSPLPAAAATLFRRGLTNRTGSRSAA